MAAKIRNFVQTKHCRAHPRANNTPTKRPMTSMISGFIFPFACLDLRNPCFRTLKSDFSKLLSDLKKIKQGFKKSKEGLKKMKEGLSKFKVRVWQFKIIIYENQTIQRYYKTAL